MTHEPFHRGNVVWHPAPFKAPPKERPFLVLSDSKHPFHGSEYAVVGLTRTNRPPAIELGPSDWRLGDPGTDSYASPWYVFTIKHADIKRPKGALTSAAIDRVATAVSSMLGVPEASE
ncbi:type II toxin-antitoxin system PemK/MazF family toxin [Halomicrobium urmianum]|uniref:type II toxin-antitoxin system PemK/MazF family toxin n=1 Tax=Halomicrobium urmianum TaxID=1586233 RepID=UPI001CDA22C1